MTNRKILIIGAGGSGREIFTLIEDINKGTPGSWDIQGFASIDKPKSEVLARLSAKYLGKPRCSLCIKSRSQKYFSHSYQALARPFCKLQVVR
jgi:hypothetical protein